MAVSIEDVLLARAQADQQGKVDPAVAMGLGAAAGGTLGLGAGAALHQLGRGINAMTGRQPRLLKPGHRMAGGLLGVMMGGALGEGVRRMTVEQSPAAALLAKIQAKGGSISPDDQLELEQVLRDTYNQTGRF